MSKHMVQRTIRNGRVRIYGIDYEPRHPLLPEHEGLRPLFGLYWLGGKRNEEFVSLWGEPDHCDDGKWPGIFCQPNPETGVGTFYWEWWYPVAALAKEGT